MQTIYIQGTKKDANAQLAEGRKVYGMIYSMHDDRRVTLSEIKEDAVIKFYKKKVAGSPYATAYGTWRPSKNKIA